MTEVTLTSYADLLDHVLTLTRAATTRPFLLGIAGPPATGKSTLAMSVVEDLSSAHGLEARYCPMDGFHLPNAQLDARKMRAVKGRIDTYEVGELLAAMQRLRMNEAFWWPAYSRTLHEPVAEGVRITGREDVCIVEGNYLLCDAPVWRDVARLFDLRVFIDAPDELLRARLFARHLDSGRDPVEARAKIARTDLSNSQSIRADRLAAEIVIDEPLSDWPVNSLSDCEKSALFSTHIQR